ncbi:MAG: 2,5-diamino-6-(ribosylamino)-4(3H)-pyrimidinone 5'-phosphate reductase [Candidatus Lokiarchaeota archaeon]|nr:2,5-diamino-6-(ribosylamino)-4(3H)-pyrimidinone 5'-phosphate reductase [Candidatus Lokiarchaeota archaeon]
MSADGKIASIVGDCEFSDDPDWKRVHLLRASVDSILVGINTISADDSKLTIKFYEPKKFPARLVVDSKLRISWDARIITVEPDKYSTIIGTTSLAPKEKIKLLNDLGIEVLICGSGPKVNLIEFLKKLKEKNIHSLLLEGGGTLNFEMLKLKLVDEVRVSIAPVIIGGKEAIPFVGGKGFKKIKDSVMLELISHEKLGNNLLIQYKVV